MSQYFFTIPPGSTLAVGKGDDLWTAIDGATSIGVEAEAGQPVRLQIIEGHRNRPRVLDTKAKGIAHPFRLTFPNGSARLFSASIITTEYEGNALISTIEIDGAVTRKHPGVEADFPPLVRTGAGGNARDLPEMGV